MGSLKSCCFKVQLYFLEGLSKEVISLLFKANSTINALFFSPSLRGLNYHKLTWIYLELMKQTSGPLTFIIPSQGLISNVVFIIPKLFLKISSPLSPNYVSFGLHKARICLVSHHFVSFMCYSLSSSFLYFQPLFGWFCSRSQYFQFMLISYKKNGNEMKHE